MSNSQTDPEPYFAVSELWKTLSGSAILRGVTTSIPRGKTTVVLGGSGSGKSVFLKHLNGLMLPDSGSIRVESEEITSLSERELLQRRKKIGVLFQDGALFDSMTVSDNVAFPLHEAGGLDMAEVAQRVEAALEQVELSGVDSKMPSALSGGMRKRIGLARAMIGEPTCLLCDEPTAGLDPLLSEMIARLIRETTESRQITSVVVTHDLMAMKLIADHVIFLKDGRVRFEGSLDEARASSDSDLSEFLAGQGGGG